jgi:hypothetical protein
MTPKIMDRTRISKKSLELKLKAKRPLRRTRYDGFVRQQEQRREQERNRKGRTEVLNARLETRKRRMSEEERKEEENEDLSAVLCLLLR